MAKRQRKSGNLPESAFDSNLKKPATKSFWKDARFRRVVGFLLLSLTIYLFLAFLSYLYTWKGDQDKIFNPSGGMDFLFNQPNPVRNNTGTLGAWLSHQLIFNGFGLSAFLLIPMGFILSFNLLRKRRLYSGLKTWFYTTLHILLLCPLFSYIFSAQRFRFPFGGAMGEKMLHWMNLTCGSLGTLFILIAFGIGLLLLWMQPLWPLFQQLSARTMLQNEEAPEIPMESYNHPQTATNAPELRIPDEFFQHELPAPETTDRETENQTLEPAMDLTEPATTSIDLDPVLPAEMETDILPASKNKSAEAEKPMMQEVPLEVVHHTEAVHNSPLPVVSIGTDEPYDPSLELRNYKYPTLDLLDQYSTDEIAIDKNELEANKNQIINTLKSFGIAISKISATVGPTVTLYEIVPAEGVRISKIRNLEDDIALSLSALGIRIIAPIPGKGTIGIEVPNLKKQIVSMRTLIASEKFIHNHYSLPIALGKKIDNENFIIDLATMPHLLMAGATGQGKSVGINAILVSLLYKKHPSQVKFVMVDPKKVELSIYKLIEKHFLAKLPNEEEAIITDTKKVINTLNALCIEMDNRYDLLKDAGVRNIKEYNEKFIKRRLNPQKGHQYLPFIVLVVDEFADLIMTAGKEVEMPIARLAQLARAVGIHLIIATQRPSVNVITGTIKANFPGRIAFRVSAKVDSRTILDSGGAEQLIGRGDMLILQGSELVRVQCAFVDTPEVERVVQFIGTQQGYPSAFDLPEYEGSDADLSSGNQGKNLKEVDQMFEQCARLVVSSGSGSTSMLQRRFNLGYNRAGRIMDQLEAAGIVTAGTGGKPRDLLVHTETELDLILSEIRNR